MPVALHHDEEEVTAALKPKSIRLVAEVLAGNDKYMELSFGPRGVVEVPRHSVISQFPDESTGKSVIEIEHTGKLIFKRPTVQSLTGVVVGEIDMVKRALASECACDCDEGDACECACDCDSGDDFFPNLANATEDVFRSTLLSQ